jgi:anti-sigma factor RsiW
MTCRDFIEFLWRYVQQELDPIERTRFDQHLAVCPDCVAYLSNYNKTIELTKEAMRGPEAPLPQDVPEDLIRAILSSRSGGRA